MAFRASNPQRKFFPAENIVKRPLAHPVSHFFERFAWGSADSFRRRVLADKFGMLPFKSGKFNNKGIVRLVAYLGSVKLVVPLLVVADERP